MSDQQDPPSERAEGGTMERWKPVKGYETIYEVSDLGRVRRIRAYRSTSRTR